MKKMNNYNPELTAEDVMYAMVNQGADPVYIEDIELAEEIAKDINNVQYCDEIERGSEDWDIAVRQLDLEENNPTHIYYCHNWNEEGFKICFFEDYSI